MPAHPDSAAIASFWTWFREHDAELQAITDSDNPFWDAVLARLAEVRPGLRFEMSERAQGAREFVITAEGKAELFGMVDEMVAAAPALAGWTFVALKPAAGFDFVIEYEGLRFDPSEMWFTPLESARLVGALGLRVGVPKLAPSDMHRATNAVLVILDTAMGERLAATSWQHVEVTALPDDPAAAKFIELPELPAFLEWRARRR